MSRVTGHTGRSELCFVRVDVDPSTRDRDRLTVGLRIILANPQLLVVWLADPRTGGDYIVPVIPSLSLERQEVLS